MSSTTTPLVEPGPEEEKEEEAKRGGCMQRLIDVEEAKAQLLFSVPMIITNMSYYAVTLVSVMFAGHLGDLELAGATLGDSWGSVTGIALVTGLSGALETLCGQGYGAKQYRMLGIYLQSSIIITLFFSILVSFMWYFSELVLIWLHQDPDVAKMASIYLRFFIPGLFAYSCLQCILRFCQTQSVVIPLVVCSVCTLVIHVGLTYLLVHALGLGYKGASLAASLSFMISSLVLATYVKFSGRFRYTWDGLTMDSFRYVFLSLKLAVPSAVMVCLEYCAFEILVLLAGLMPNSKNSTSLIATCLDTEAISYMITFGFSATVSTRVSNEMGAGNIKKAKNAVSVTLKLSCFLALIVLLLLGFGHNVWARAFTDNATIIQEFASMIPLLSVSILLDSAQGVLSGVARVCGWQHLAAWTNLVTFYLFGMPLAFLFGFKLGLYDKTGLSGALETLCGQGYGAKSYRMLGIYLQSSIIITTFFSVLVSFLWYFSEPVLIWLHQEPDVAKMASVYLKYLIPGLFAYAYLQCVMRFLQTQSVVTPLVGFSVLTLVFDIGLTHLLVHSFGFGFKGASLACSISFWISLLMLAVYVKCSWRFRYTWDGLSIESFQYVFPSLKLAIPSAVMVCLEYCAFEILVLLAGLLPNAEKSTSLIAMCESMEAIAYMITYGFSAAVSTRVSNEMGAGNVKEAKNAVSVTLKLSCLLALTVLLSLAFGHDIWARSFTSNTMIVQEFASMTPFLSVSILLDSAQGVLSGVARGCGWQEVAAWTNLVAFYIIGMPLALLFGFKLGLHEQGLWLGLICGLFCQATILLVITLRSKWTRLDSRDHNEPNCVLV